MFLWAVFALNILLNINAYINNNYTFAAWIQLFIIIILAPVAFHAVWSQLEGR